MGESIKGYVILVIFMSVCCAVICLGIKKKCQKKMENIYQDLLKKLDRAVSGKMEQEIYDESLDAAVTERLNRVIQIQKMDKGRAEKERDSVKSLISDISHQVRTPLSNIMLYTQLLNEKELDKDVSYLIGKIRKQSDKLDFFIKELVKSSYMEQEIINVSKEMIKVSEIVEMACQTVELAALKKEIIIKQEINVRENADYFCYADKKWTIEAVGNVLENAVKYSPPKSVVNIKVIPYDFFTCIQVEDNGIGICESEQGLVYERFYRSKDAKDQPGFGIGLYLVREILSKQGGYSKIKSKKGKGTTIQIFLSNHGD